jgi:hypothetical protein
MSFDEPLGSFQRKESFLGIDNSINEDIKGENENDFGKVSAL